MFLTGCGAGTNSSDEERGPTNVTNTTKVDRGGTDLNITEFTTEKGDYCVVVEGYESTGLACDFGVDTP